MKDEIKTKEKYIEDVNKKNQKIQIKNYQMKPMNLKEEKKKIKK